MSEPVIKLKSAALELAFEPEQGGKWRSLRDRRTGREWLWNNPHLPVSPIVYGDSFIEKHDTGGWDEIFPSVSPCGDIPDHGDLVQLPWQVDTHTETRLTMSLEGRCYPFRFERTITLSDTEIRCNYQLQNTGDRAFPWLWCAHPLLAFSPELTLELDGTFYVEFAMGAARELEGRKIQVSELPGHENPWAAKLFSLRATVDEVTARHSDGSGLCFAWDPRQVPYLGLWINNGGWSGCASEPYFNIGIEPSTLPLDNLNEAKAPSVLNPGDSDAWALEVNLL